MLVFEPSKRITVNEAVKHPVFKGIRKAEEETVAAAKIVLDFESEPELDEARLRKYFILEIRRYHPEVQMPPHLRGL